MEKSLFVFVACSVLFATGCKRKSTEPITDNRTTEGQFFPPYYLHDGRARTLIEAIMWHGGEAAAARDFFHQLQSSDRAALISFLKSL